jgi:uncharacterized protein with PQ loop repeat
MADIIGWAGSVCLAFCALPQAVQSWRQGHSAGMANSFLIFWGVGEILYIYATLASFGTVFWLMFNYILNFLCLLVICRYRWWPRKGL